MLGRLLPQFLSLWEGGPVYVIRAVRYFLTGYSDIYEPIAQYLVWVAGIEAILSKGDAERPSDLLGLLFVELGKDWNIYEDSALADLTKADVQLRTIGEDLFRFRNALTHGGWVPDDWIGRMGRLAPNGSIEYPDMLIEAAAAILRKLLMNWLTLGAALR